MARAYLRLSTRPIIRYGYNEVLVNTAGWKRKLPEAIEAIFWVSGVHIGRRTSDTSVQVTESSRLGGTVRLSSGQRALSDTDAASSENEARSVYSAFMRSYPHASTRLLKWDLMSNLDAPFIDVLGSMR